ncbi:MAG: hypothetical protein ACFB20_00435 [Opitutales bacterium]
MHLILRFTSRALTLVVCACPFLAHAGSIRDDVDEQVYLDFAANHPFSDAVAILETTVGGAGFASTATLISPTQVLTAAHPFLDLGPNLEIEGIATSAQVTFGVSNISDLSGAITRSVSSVDLLFEPVPAGSPGFIAVDLAIINLAEPVFGIDPAPLILGTLPTLPPGSAFFSQTVGYGQFGNGADGITGGFGVQRGGRNLAFEVTGVNDFLFVNHDDPANNPDPLVDSPSLAEEYTPLPGDSGSGLWLEDAEQNPLGIVGVTSFGFTAEDGAELGQYGTVAGYSLIGPFITLNDEGIVSFVPEPATVSLWLGLAALAGAWIRRRVRQA